MAALAQPVAQPPDAGPPVRHPAAWVPTLYFAQGLPFFAVASLAAILYKRMGEPNDVITLYTGWLLLPWSLKPLWSPLLEMYKTKKFFVVLFQIVGGLSLALLALSLPLPGYFRYTIALLAVTALSSSTHDIACDGLYIASLSAKQQAAYAGWISALFNVARFFSQGALVYLAGTLEARLGVAGAWQVVFGIAGALLIVLGVYHSFILPSGGAARTTQSLREAASTFGDVVTSLVRKPNIVLLLVFIVLYRTGEGQVQAVGKLFALDARTAGGLGLTTTQVGTIYGVYSIVAFMVGSVLGGYFTSWLGLRRALPWLIIIMNAPNAAYVYLSTVLPTSTASITAALCVEMFGYGFGFVGVLVLMMQEVAPGPYQTAHYAIASALMNLGLMLPAMVSGKLQLALGYRNFFIWALISAIPALVLSRFIPLRGGAPEEAAAA